MDPAIPAQPAVFLEDVAVHFGDVVAVDGVGFTVPRGSVVGIIGPSGSGKTTTIRTITGAIRPDGGTVRVLGEDPRRLPAGTRERIGYMPQVFQLHPDLTVQENADFVGALFGMLWRRRGRRVREALDLVGLWDVRGRRAGRLSTGMQRRLALACALVHEPELVILDEPTAAIDPLLRTAIWAELRRLRDDGRAVLVTTHYVGEAEYCDAVAVLAAGRTVAIDTPEGLRRRAFGGDVIEVEADRAFDAGALASVPGVVGVRQREPRTALVTVDDAGTATPRIAEAIGGLGAEVRSSREHRASFDQVFARIVAAPVDPFDAFDLDPEEAAGVAG